MKGPSGCGVGLNPSHCFLTVYLSCLCFCGSRGRGGGSTRSCAATPFGNLDKSLRAENLWLKFTKEHHRSLTLSGGGGDAATSAVGCCRSAVHLLASCSVRMV